MDSPGFEMSMARYGVNTRTLSNECSRRPVWTAESLNLMVSLAPIHIGPFSWKSRVPSRGQPKTVMFKERLRL